VGFSFGAKRCGGFRQAGCPHNTCARPVALEGFASNPHASLHHLSIITNFSTLLKSKDCYFFYLSNICDLHSLLGTFDVPRPNL
jgi:hypothetical protein